MLILKNEINMYFKRLKNPVSIIMVNYNGWDDTKTALHSIFAREPYLGFQVIVIDNASKENKAEELSLLCRDLGYAFYDISSQKIPPNKPFFNREVVFHRLRRNKGFGGGCNEGIRFALSCGAEYVWLINTDTLLGDFAISHLLSLADYCGTSVAIVGSKLHCYPEVEKVQFDGTAVYYKGIEAPYVDVDRVKCVPFVSGASMLIRSSFLRKHGFLREDFFLYFEDNEICLRAIKLGYRVVYNPFSVVYHKGGSTIGPFMNSTLSLYYGIRNSFFFYSEFNPQKIYEQIESIEQYIKTEVKRGWHTEKAKMVTKAIRDFLSGEKGPMRQDENIDTHDRHLNVLLHLERRFLSDISSISNLMSYFTFVKILLWQKGFYNVK